MLYTAEIIPKDKLAMCQELARQMDISMEVFREESVFGRGTIIGVDFQVRRGMVGLLIPVDKNTNKYMESVIKLKMG